MSSFVDDQLEEIEVLQSIFPTEFEQLESPNKFKIHISPGCEEIHGNYSIKSDPEVYFFPMSSSYILNIFTIYRKI
jgi:RWD domain